MHDIISYHQRARELQQAWDTLGLPAQTLPTFSLSHTYVKGQTLQTPEQIANLVHERLWLMANTEYAALCQQAPARRKLPELQWWPDGFDASAPLIMAGYDLMEDLKHEAVVRWLGTTGAATTTAKLPVLVRQRTQMIFLRNQPQPQAQTPPPPPTQTLPVASATSTLQT